MVRIEARLAAKLHRARDFRPGMASGLWLGYQLRPLLAPLTLRAKPLPTTVKVGLAVGAVALLLLGARALAGGGVSRGNVSARRRLNARYRRGD